LWDYELEKQLLCRRDELTTYSHREAYRTPSWSGASIDEGFKRHAIDKLEGAMADQNMDYVATFSFSAKEITVNLDAPFL
jgi:hypothetical protein